MWTEAMIRLSWIKCSVSQNAAECRREWGALPSQGAGEESTVKWNLFCSLFPRIFLIHRCPFPCWHLCLKSAVGPIQDMLVSLGFLRTWWFTPNDLILNSSSIIDPSVSPVTLMGSLQVTIHQPLVQSYPIMGSPSFEHLVSHLPLALLHMTLALKVA